MPVQGCDLYMIHATATGKPNRSSLSQNCRQRSGVSIKARRLSTTAAPFSFQRMPERHRRCFTNVLQAASVTPEPIGRWWSRAVA